MTFNTDAITTDYQFIGGTLLVVYLSPCETKLTDGGNTWLELVKSGPDTPPPSEIVASAYGCTMSEKGYAISTSIREDEALEDAIHRLSMACIVCFAYSWRLRWMPHD